MQSRKNETAIVLYQSGTLTIEQAARLCPLSQDEFEKQAKH